MFGATEDQSNSTRELSVRELNAMIPRKVRLDPDGGYAGLVLSLLLLCIGAALLGYLYYAVTTQMRQTDVLHREGREVAAVVTKFASRRRGPTIVYYRFSAEGLFYLGHASLPDYGDVDARVGKPIHIRYLPSNPFVNHPSAWDWSMSWRDSIASLITLLIPGAGIVGLGSLYRERRLARIGWVTEGTVIACAPKGKRFRVDYEFYDEQHVEFDGANEFSDEYETGSNIRVIYLKNNPKRNDTYPMSTFHTVGE